MLSLTQTDSNDLFFRFAMNLAHTKIYITAFGFSMAPESEQMNGHFYLLNTEL